MVGGGHHKQRKNVYYVFTLLVFFFQKVACIFDNGTGMTSEGMKAFASYFLSQEDRGLEKGSSHTFGYMDGNISKFGVGATQAVSSILFLSETRAFTKNMAFVLELIYSIKVSLSGFL